MNNESKSGWYKEDGIWYLYHKGKVIANFCLTENSDPVKMMYDCKLIDKYAEEIEISSGNINEAKSIIEGMLIRYCSNQIEKWYTIRHDILKVAAKRR